MRLHSHILSIENSDNTEKNSKNWLNFNDILILKKSKKCNFKLMITYINLLPFNFSKK